MTSVADAEREQVAELARLEEQPWRQLRRVRRAPASLAPAAGKTDVQKSGAIGNCAQ
jgi:hypothetical protein